MTLSEKKQTFFWIKNTICQRQFQENYLDAVENYQRIHFENIKWKFFRFMAKSLMYPITKIDFHFLIPNQITLGTLMLWPSVQCQNSYVILVLNKYRVKHHCFPGSCVHMCNFHFGGGLCLVSLFCISLHTKIIPLEVEKQRCRLTCQA